MGYNLSDKLVVAVSSRALFDLEAENKIFEEMGLDGYYEYQLQNENTPLSKGTGYRLVENLLKIQLSLPSKREASGSDHPLQKQRSYEFAYHQRYQRV